MPVERKKMTRVESKVELFIFARTSFFVIPQRKINISPLQKKYKKKLLRVGKKIKALNIESNIFLGLMANQKNG